ncbi:MAG: arylesterase [Nitrospina sp.]|nr:arylesterase [Nitrospina sp.]
MFLENMNKRYVFTTYKNFNTLMVFLIWVLFLFFPANLVGGSSPVILAFGDSLTAGFGVPDTESYPARLQNILIKNGYTHKVVNAGVSGDTTAGGVRRIKWLMKNNPEIVILELGANDGLRGLSLQEMESNLEKIIIICEESGAKVLLTGMKAPPNYGEEYTVEFEKTFFRLAEKYKLPLVPFFLEDVAGVREHTQSDGIHPLGSGYSIVVQTIWEYLKPLLDANSKTRL